MLTSLQNFLSITREYDKLEEASYYRIIEDRLEIIRKIQQAIEEQAKEDVFRDYLFDHLWLLDPTWDRTTADPQKEKAMKTIIERIDNRSQGAVPKGSSNRIDIKYRKAPGTHVIVELKRYSASVSKTDLESQITKYMKEFGNYLKSTHTDQKNQWLEGICVIGKMGWGDPEEIRRELESLKVKNIKVFTYDDLIQQAEAIYSDFLTKEKEHNEINKLLRQISEYTKSDQEK